MARKIPEWRRNEDLSLEEIETAVNSVAIHSRSRKVCFTFIYGGLAREGLIKNRRATQVHPYGHKAQLMASLVVNHILSYPQSFIPKHLMLRVLIGND